MKRNSKKSVLIRMIILHLFFNLFGNTRCVELMQNDPIKDNENIDLLNVIRNSSKKFIELTTTTRTRQSFQNKTAHSIGLSIMPEDKMLDAWSKPDNTFQMFGNPNSRKSTLIPQISGRKTSKDLPKQEEKKAKSPKEQIDDYKKRVLQFLVQKGFVTITQPTSTTTEKVKDDLKSTKERGKNILQAIPVERK